MADVIELPTAAKQAIPKQRVRGKAPKGVIPAHRLQLRRRLANGRGKLVSETSANGATMDVRAALLGSQSDPEVPRPRDLDEAIDARARELAEEAFLLCREHLRRRVAYGAERGWPRVLNTERAYQLIDEGDLGDALVRAYHEKLRHIVWSAQAAAKIGSEFTALVAEVTEAAGFQIKPRK